MCYEEAFYKLVKYDFKPKTTAVASRHKDWAVKEERQATEGSTGRSKI
jgi:hypothetical protein